MKKPDAIKITKLMLALLLVSAGGFAMGSFTGTAENKAKNIYSLKNFNRNFYKTASPFSLRSGFQYRGSQIVSIKKESNGDLTLNSMLRYEKGNTTYIYPYKHKVPVPKFKTPAPPSLR